MVDTTLGERASLLIHPRWKYRSLWRHPLGSILRFMYIDFEEGITESSAANYADIDVIGRGEPYRTFISTGAREIQITFRFHNQQGNLRDEVVLPARFLDALKYPVFDSGSQLSYEPPLCLLKIGSLLTARVILTGGDPTWRGPVDVDSLLPHYSEFQATFSVVREAQADLGYRFDGNWQ